MERNALNLIMLNYQRTCTGSFPIVIVTVTVTVTVTVIVIVTVNVTISLLERW